MGCVLLLAGLAGTGIGDAAAQSGEAALKEQIRAMLVPSPYRMSPAALRGTVRYRLEERGAPGSWPWPATGEQRVSQEQGATQLTVCATCGRETAPTEAELARYRAPNRWLQSDDRTIVHFARAARGGTVDARMRRLVAAVQERLSGPVSYRGYLTAREALELRGGDCTEYALLLAAAARSRGIPARVVAGLAYGSRFVGKPHAFGPHMWVQAWSGERWVSYDAGLGVFDAGHLALAVGDGSPESLQGALRAIGRLRVVEAVGLVPTAGEDATR